MIEHSIDDRHYREFVTEEDLQTKLLEKVRKFPKLKEIRARKVGRNEPCPCGSGIKFKKCCIRGVGKGAKEVGSFAG